MKMEREYQIHAPSKRPKLKVENSQFSVYVLVENYMICFMAL
jgi:hypothetical protein